MVPAVSGPFRGRAQGRAQGRVLLTRSEGGVSTKRGGGCQHPPFHFSLSLFGFFVLDRTTRAAPAGRDWTGATPPF